MEVWVEKIDRFRIFTELSVPLRNSRVTARSLP
jgi:hypothetical protein